VKRRWIILGIAFVFGLFACLCIGRYPIRPAQVIRLLLAGLGMDSAASGSLADPMVIFWNIRVPRVLLAMLAGAGISAAGAVFQAGLSFIMYLANPYDQLAQIIFWTMGSFHTASWARIQATLPVLVPGIALLVLFSWRLNIMTQGEEDALSLGVPVMRWRIFYVLVSTLMVAAAVAAAGTVAWIGLIVPHIARYLAGPEHTRLIPMSAFLGGLFLMVMDSVARSVMLSEIPISIVTSIFGAPFLGYLVIHAGKARMSHDT